MKRPSTTTLAAIGILILALVAILTLTRPWAGGGPDSGSGDHASANHEDKTQATAKVKTLSNKFLTAVKNQRRTVSFLPQAQAMVKQYPTLVPARILLAQVLMRSGRLKRAASQLQRAVELDPDQARVRVLLGAVRQKLGEFLAAKAQFVKAIALAPDKAGYRLKLANAQIKAGELDDARTTALQALTLDSQEHEAHMLLSQIGEKQHQLNFAESQMAKAIKLVPNENRRMRRVYICRRAKLLRRANRPRDALSVLRELPARDLYTLGVSKDLAATFGQMGQPMLAGEHYAIMVNHNPANARAARQAIHWYLKAGDVDAAQAMLGKFQQVKPHSKQLTELRRTIKQAKSKSPS